MTLKLGVGAKPIVEWQIEDSVKCILIAFFLSPETISSTLIPLLFYNE